MIPVVVGSSPISHPKEFSSKQKVTSVKLVAFFVLTVKIGTSTDNGKRYSHRRTAEQYAP